MITLFLIIAIFPLLLLWYRFKYRERFAMIAKLPGPYRYPLLGNIPQFIWKSPSEMIDLMLHYQKEFPKIGCYMFGPVPFIAITDPRHAEVILGNRKYVDKSDEYYFFTDWLGTGVFTLKGEKWAPRRKALAHAFQHKCFDEFIGVFDKQSGVFAEKLAQHKGKVLDVSHMIKRCTFEIICETALGIELNDQIESNNEYVHAVHEINSLVHKRIFNAHLRSDFIFYLSEHGKKQKKLLKIIRDFTDNIVAMRKKSPVDIETKKNAKIIDILMQLQVDGQLMTDTEIRDELNVLIFAGYDTASYAIGFCLYFLSKHPDVQQKAFEEIRDVIGDDPDAPLTLESLNSLKYLEMVIKETMRIYPSVHAFARKVNENVDINGYLIPKGSNVGICPFLMARDPELWEDPLVFDPERFGPDKKIHPYQHIPFCGGVRSCLGQKYAMLEMKAILSKLLRKYVISAAPDYEPILVAEVVLRTENGVEVIFNERG